jgi:spore photoproduct lyase
VTRAYANVDEVLEATREFEGPGTVTSRSRDRAEEGTTFEASCYTDPLGSST